MEHESKKAGIGLSREVCPGVYLLETGKGISRANVYFVQAGSSWVLIDAGLANCGQLIRQTAERLFGENSHPSSILLTHNHPDHAGSARELARVWDCPIYVHPDELPYVAIDDLPAIEKYANPLDRWMILPILRVMPRKRVESMLSGSSLKDIVRCFDPSGAVPGLPGWKCIPTPGHTPGHVAFFRTSDRVLITGDAVVTVDLNSIWGFLRWSLRINQQKVSGPPRYSTWNWQAAKASVAILAGLEPVVVTSGHGAPMSGAEIAAALHSFSDHFSV